MDKVTLKFNGESPLLMHSCRGADPFDPLAKELKKLTSVRKKTDDIHVQVARLEWELGLYIDKDLGPYLPTINMRGAIVEAARLRKLGKDFERGTMLESDKARLEYKGQRDPEGMWASNNFRDCRSVVVGTARVMRTRPIFHPHWSVTFSLLFNEDVVQRDNIVDAARSAGAMIGLGDYRPNCGGSFGRFSVEVLP